jgi:hypothetical protein
MEKAAVFWGKAGQRSLARSALVEAAAQLTRALDQIADLPATPALRREQIKLQVDLANTLMHVKGYAAPETKLGVEEARLFIERSEALGEPLEDPLLLFSALYGLWAVNFVAFNGGVCLDLATHFLALAEKHEATIPILIGHRIMGHSLLKGGDFVQARIHYDKGSAIYDPVEHRTLATRFGHDTGVALLSYRSLAAWLSEGRAKRRVRCRGSRPRDGSSRFVNVCTLHEPRFSMSSAGTTRSQQHEHGNFSLSRKKKVH